MARILATTTSALILASCGGSPSQPYNERATPEEIEQAEADMAAWPPVDEAEAQLADTIQQIAAAATSVAPEMTWQPRVNRGINTLGCPLPYLDTDGVSMSTDWLTSDVAIADADWEEVLGRARDIAARIGLTEISIRTDEPGAHDVELYSPTDGNKIDILTRDNAVIGGVTGCRFKAEDLPHPNP